MRIGGSAHAAVAAAIALGSAGLAGGPLYVSSAATAHLHSQLATTCLADVGLQVPVYEELGPGVSSVITDAPTRSRVLEPVLTAVLAARATDASGRSQPVVLVSRPGQERQLGMATLKAGEAAVSAQTVKSFSIGRGDRLQVEPAFVVEEAEPVELTVVEEHPDIPVFPEPSFWCGLRDLFRPSGFGDLPPPALLVARETLEGAGWLPDVTAELRPDVDGLTRARAVQLSWFYADTVDEYRALVTDAAEDLGEPVSAGDVEAAIRDRSQVRVLVERAEVVATVVGRTAAPVVLTAVIAAWVVLVAAGLLVVRRCRPELRLRVLRGTHPVEIGARIAAAVAPAGLIGAVVGFGLAVAAIVTLGPSSLLEPVPVRTAFLLGLLGGVLGILTVGLVGSIATSGIVDRAPHRFRLRIVPWELIPVALAVVSYRRLDRLGGVELVGATVRGGDVLVQAFPLLAVAAILALLVRPGGWLLGLLRRHGRDWPLGSLLGVRRLSSDVATTISATLAVAFVVGLAVLATTARASAEQSWLDKGRTVVGSDLVVRAIGPAPIPLALTDRATVVLRLRAGDDSGDVEVIGIDPETFARGVHWLPGAAGRPLSDVFELLETPPAGGSDITGVVIGGAAADTLTTPTGRDRLGVDTVATMPWFPGEPNRNRILVVDAETLANLDVPMRREIWVRHPPFDTVERLEAAGWRPVLSFEATGALDATGFRAAQYAFGTFNALAGLAAVVIVIAELLVINARRRQRAAAAVINTALGLSGRRSLVATIIEVAVPFLVGVALGLAVGLAVFATANERLDVLRSVPPPARIVLDGPGLVILLVTVAVVLGAVLGVAAVASRPPRPMEAMRGGD